MKERIILIDLKDKNWLKKSINKAIKLNSKQFDITKINLNQFDQLYSFKLIYNELKRVLKSNISIKNKKIYSWNN